ncbi:hypothetical protein FQN54_008279 [Arachnomyces sp. PD_36]|nr:hypothetical protein FQN54_008279 [Arachnomyces sp. PD_36]
MTSLWGSKPKSPRPQANGDNVHSDENGHPSPRTRVDHREDPDERTSLLRGGGEGGGPGYLNPDDPAVSPYNLWSVRALRIITGVLLIISFIWWIVLLVSIFVSPPMMNSRGSGFFPFSFTTLTVGNLLIALIFFAVPSRPITIWGLILSVFLAVDMFVILGVPRLRIEEGWVGIASVIWATLIGLYLIVQNRAVTAGKRSEEERLTGREETRRPLKEWLAVLAATIIMGVMAIVAILLTATLILRARDATLPPEGKRYYVDGDKYQVHLACVGNTTNDKSSHRQPTVLLEGGEHPVEDSFRNWVQDAYGNGTISRYCYWDPPGFGWSDNAPSPHSAGMSADALSDALVAAEEEGPWIVVAAGSGAIRSRIFASRHVREVKGIFLVDALHEDYLPSLARSNRGFLLWLRGILSPLGLDRLAGAIFKGRSREDRVYGRSAYQGGKVIKSKLQENLVANSLTAGELSSAQNIQSPDTPLVVVSSGKQVKKSEEWAQKQEDLTKVTDNLVAWDVVKDAPHEVWKTFNGRRVLEKRLGQLVKKG